MAVKLGQALFERPWVAAPATTRQSDGLGPLYNARSCASCHPGGGSKPPFVGGQPTVGLLVRLARTSDRGVTNDPVYGTQLQPFALSGIPAEGTLAVRWQSTAEGLRHPKFSVEQPGYGPLAPNTRLLPRRSPPLGGLGELARVPAEHIEAQADPDDRDGDGVSGRMAYLAEAPEQLGRFGWKATAATLRAQVGSALLNDMGLSTPTQPQPAGDCQPAQTVCVDAPHGDDELAGVEISDEFLDMITAFVARLPPPGHNRPPHPGERLFTTTGCASCHTPRVSDTLSSPAYTDLLLHDLGPRLADSIALPGRSAAEWRTPPLWGLSNRLGTPEIGLLHDGRADSLDAAIRWHGGEADGAVRRYLALNDVQRHNLLQFLRQL